ncbi:hypothetical protein QYF36_026954 [Acer negundo]|nr:hypothetical protein QYF36_022695 [Acer negundo]KAK4834694.1 hypothetical protein QYF36_026954 [Acer negundo]
MAESSQFNFLCCEENGSRLLEASSKSRSQFGKDFIRDNSGSKSVTEKDPLEAGNNSNLKFDSARQFSTSDKGKGT